MAQTVQESSTPKRVHPAQPHDALFRAIARDPRRATLLFLEHLPQQIRIAVSDKTLVPVDSSLVDKGLRQSHCDLLFRTSLVACPDTAVYVLFEHKSYRDPRTPDQLARYCRLILRSHRQHHGEGGSIPYILPIVFYHGDREWNTPREDSWMAWDFVLGRDSSSRTYLVCDLKRMPWEELSQDPHVRSGLGTLALPGKAESPELERIFVALEDEPELRDDVIYYVIKATTVSDEVLRQALNAVGSDSGEETMDSIANTIEKKSMAEGMARGRAEGMAEGKVEGMAQGRAEGKAEMLLRQLQKRFEPVPETVQRRVLGASVEELEAWADAVLDASSIDGVLSASPKT